MYAGNLPDSSSVIFGKDVAQVLKARGYRVRVCDTIKDSEAFHKNYVLNFREHLTGDLLKMNRFIHMEAVASLHAEAVENYSEQGWIAMVSNFMKPKAFGVPVSLVAISQYQYNQISRRVNGTFKPSVAKAVMANVRLYPGGVLPNFKSEGTNDRQLFIVPANRVNAPAKNLDLHSKVTTQVKTALAVKGHQTVHVFRYGPNYGSEKYPVNRFDLSCYKMMEQPKKRSSYVKQARRYGISISTSRYESFGLYYCELIASGVVVVFLDREWNRLLFPEYEYRCDADNLAALTLDTYNNYSEAQAYMLTTVRPYLDRHYRIGRLVDSLLKNFGPGVEACRLTT